jgi:hypothetical protein
MKKITNFSYMGLLQAGVAVALIASAALYTPPSASLEASSHREAPLILADPLADNTDVYAFRSPDDTNRITIIANYIPFQKPDGGPNYASFGEDIRYQFHIKNDAATVGDDITYRFTFNQVNEDSTTFFNIRLGQQNLKTTYTLERKIGTNPFAPIITNGIVPPNNIGPRSINSPVGLNTTYDALVTAATLTASTGEKVFAGPRDDPFFVDLGAIFDLGAVRNAAQARDGLKNNNIHSLVLQIPITTLQKDGRSAAQKTSILDGNYVIGVWASADRPQIKTLSAGRETATGNFIQVSRLGMPLTNEAVIPIGYKDKWNSQSAYNEDTQDTTQIAYFANPELGLYMDDSAFGPAVPGLAPLRIQTRSLRGLLPGFPGFDFRNGKNGVAAIKGSQLLDTTALAESAFGGYLLRRGQPRRVDLLPIFHTGVPNLRPYQLATGKAGGNPLKEGKPFINNFLPTFGDMLRLNMAVPPTPRNSPDFSSNGLIQAAVLGLTDARFNGSRALQFIPNMDGFPNGRRLEDDVTRIELQAVGGAVLAAIGLWYDDYTIGTTASPVTPNLVRVLGFNTGITSNDTTFRSTFPYVQTPWSGFNNGGQPYRGVLTSTNGSLNLATEKNQAIAFPNPFVKSTTIRFNLASAAKVQVRIYDITGKQVAIINENAAKAGINNLEWNPASRQTGTYLANIYVNGKPYNTVKMVMGE